MKINECEALHEIVITPQTLRDIAGEMEQKSRNEFYQRGQIVRYKVNHLFCFVYKPERPICSMKNEDFDEMQVDL